MNKGFDYPTLLGKMGYTQDAKQAFFKNYQTMLSDLPAQQSSL